MRRSRPPPRSARRIAARVQPGTLNATSRTLHALFQAIKGREDELRALDGQLAALNEPVDQRLAVVPTWVASQLRNVADLISDAPERAKAEFLRLDIRVELHPVRDEGERLLRAVGFGDFEHLAFSQYSAFPTTATTSPRSAGSRKFVVDLPANQL